MAKVKVTKKELPFLKSDLELDETVLKELYEKQERFKAVFKDKIESSKKESLARYKTKIESLNAAKVEKTNELNAKIKNYRALIKKIDEPVRKTPVRKGPVKKTPVKKTPIKKIAARKTSTTRKKK